MGCIESAFLYHASPSVNSFMDEDLPALNLFLQYLTQLEGPLWKQIRGAGLAYGYNLSLMPHEGLLYLALYRASNATAAFKETKNIIVRIHSLIISLAVTQDCIKLRKHFYNPMLFGNLHN